MTWKSTLGACVGPEGTNFRVWAPEVRAVELALKIEDKSITRHRMQKQEEGYHTLTLASAKPGAHYGFMLDGEGPFPDPASRFQPDGVHGPSAIVDSTEFRWTDSSWHGIASDELVFYELHLGTFSPEGTFDGAKEKLGSLKQLGVTAVELMPVADFAGSRNWGYDGVAPFAPSHNYGTPDELRSLVDAAHQLGLAVVMDVVYNHFGPDGAYHRKFSPYYYSVKHRSPWGDGINFDGPNREPVRDYFIENALYWIHEYHMDGLRLDATHTIVDDSKQHLLASISAAVKQSFEEDSRKVHLIAEDVRNLNYMLQSRSSGGWGLDAVWSDDFHHQLRRALAGDSDGYFKDFDGTTRSIAETARDGWFYHGQHAEYFGHPRGTDPSGIAYPRFVHFLQNHDQIGNRARGDRLHHSVALDAYRAATVFWLLLPETPMLFMGQEWAATTPFLYFTDHHTELGKLVTEGRRSEFQQFAAFADPASWTTIPDPQALNTFEASRLRWEELGEEPHRSTRNLYCDLLKLRREHVCLRSSVAPGELKVAALGQDGLGLRRESSSGEALLAVIRLRGSGTIQYAQGRLAALPEGGSWSQLLTTEDSAYTHDSLAPKIALQESCVEFHRPGAVIFHSIGREAR